MNTRRNFLAKLAALVVAPVVALRTGKARAIDVRDFGAVGDGLTCDRAAFQRALDSALDKIAESYVTK